MEKELRNRMLDVARQLVKLATNNQGRYLVILKNIDWDTEDDEGNKRDSKQLGLPSEYQITVSGARNENMAVETALSEISDYFGWLINGSEPSVSPVEDE